ncbi:NAD(P)/FAD-dependent oxidoreductase [Paenibacillus sp. YPG26]|uniref:flavin-containing monooxygenase n=1 Tax=Paenibacillus sp. YPG26 TaxID=2878915 RepID=UPI00203E91D0|nr:NAD(P)/FAD-dependent oxidoreductase [Paenibacillus sp. YPG26]USB33657.1 NAD(P)/FAD-dependent oxidoreductase [Paenibacillus sp. YPG26]
MRSYDVIVIGAGQAGLAAGYFLRQSGLSFILLDQHHQVGSVWRERYDSLILFTPRFYSALPGLSLEGDPNGYAAKDEIADYLHSYAKHFELPIQLNTEVLKVSKTEDRFLLETNQGQFSSRHVIVAAGPFQKPLIPQISGSISSDVIQLHTANYRNSSQLQEGPMLVVGGGNSGAQIAVELADQYPVTLSASHKIRFMPVQLMSKSIFWWFGKLRVYQASVHSRFGQWLRNKPDPVFGYELKNLLAKGSVNLKPRTKAAVNGDIVFEDNTSIPVKNIIWATGYYSDYRWIDIPDAIDEKGKPRHDEGVSPVAGLYYVGMPWQRNRSSALLGGVGRDAEAVVTKIIKPYR